MCKESASHHVRRAELSEPDGREEIFCFSLIFSRFFKKKSAKIQKIDFSKFQIFHLHGPGPNINYQPIDLKILQNINLE